MPAKKKSAAASAATPDSIHRELQKALSDASKKLKGAKGGDVDAKLKLIKHCKGILDDIWFC